MTRARLPILGSTIARRCLLGIGGALFCLVVRGALQADDDADRVRWDLIGTEDDEDDDEEEEDDCKTRTLKRVRNLEPFKNENGRHATYSTSDEEELDLDNPFFKPLGNGRACASCHAPEDAFSISLPSIRERFDESCGNDPLFVHDGTDNPNRDRRTLEARRDASSLLLNFGVIRMELPLPEPRDFDLVAVSDPTGNVSDEGCGTPDGCSATTIVVFRRPLMASNLRFPSDTIMFDGREPSLSSQATNATLIHAQSAPSAEDVDAIVDFETKLFTTQVVGPAGKTTKEGATGDPVTHSGFPFTNDMNRPPAVPCPPGTPTSPIGTTGPCRRFPLDVVDPDVFHEFDSWASSEDAARQSVARGQAIFNRRALKNPVQITNPVLMACSNCHNIPGSGGGSGDPTNVVGISLPEFRVPGMPLYTVRIRATGRLIQTTDPGQAMTTGMMAATSQNAFKTPQLRGLAAHAPYFHNGMARTIEDVVEFYNVRFKAEFTDEEKADLAAFLKSL
jgi:cytochrome c peroxidase